MAKIPTPLITIKQLALALNVSHSTVSRALNGHQEISQETKERVRAAAVRFGYVANGAARLLKRDQGRAIGLIIPDIKNRFYSKTAKAIADAASARALQLVLFTTDDDPVREAQALRSLSEARAAAVIITPTEHPQQSTLDLLQRLDVVQLIRRHTAIGGPAVVVDDVAGIRIATDHLLLLGHERIAYLGTPLSLSTGAGRMRGFRQAFAAAGKSVCEDLVVIGAPRAQVGGAAFERILAVCPPPTAMVIASPELAEGGLLAAFRNGVDVPGRLSVVCYGDFPWYELVYGGVTAVRLPEDDIAGDCVNLLFAPADEKRVEGVCLRPILMVRGSTRPHSRAAAMPCKMTWPVTEK
jgi:DNA-binding LacI/PurR family transcriptional regulator